MQPNFTFYLHDRADYCQLELLGSLSEQHIPELEGCCTTVRTTLHGRKLMIDTRKLSALDAAGEQWLAEKRAEGAEIMQAKSGSSKRNEKQLKNFFTASSSSR